MKRLMQPDPTPLDDLDARLALTALLVRVARSDGDYATGEIRRIDRILCARYGIDPGAARDLRTRAEVLEDEAPDTVRFTRAIKDTVPYDDRLSVIEALWQVALADGARDAHEDSILRLVSTLLGISDRDSALARQRMSGQA